MTGSDYADNVKLTNWVKIAGDKCFGGAVFVDFPKVFNKINHDLLITNTGVP